MSYFHWVKLFFFPSFSRAASPAKLVQQVLALKAEEQLQVFNMLKESLTKRGLLAIQ